MSKLESLEDRVKPITCYSNWCDFDRLDGVDLVDGENLCVLWPDGTHGYHKVKLVKGSNETLEQGGGSYGVPFKKAYISVKIHGARAEIRLYESGLQAVRVTDDNREKD